MSNLQKQTADLLSHMDSRGDFIDRMEDLDESGFSQIFRFLHKHLFPQKQVIITRTALIRTHGYIQTEGNYLKERMRIVRESGKESLFILGEKLGESMQNLKNWQQTIYRAEERRLIDHLVDLKSDYHFKIQETFDPNGKAISEYYNSEEQRFTSVEQLSSAAEDTLDRFAGFLIETGGTLLLEYQECGQTALTDAVKHCAESIIREVNVDRPSIGIRIKNDGFMDVDALKNAYIEGSILTGIASILTAIAVGVGIFAAPGIGVLLPPLVGGLFGWFHGYKKTKDQKLDIALKDLRNGFSNIARLALKSVSKEFDRISREIERNARESLEKLYTQTLDDLKGQIEEVRKTKMRTNSENQAALKQLSQSFSVLVKLDQSIRKYV